ncbi:MAG: malate dehydrogenase [Planctomycetes bacterium]|nr:malate dehydrogenase [Planctomycetota bacterium]
MSRKLVGVVGAGNVGATVAQSIVNTDLCDVRVFDVVEGLPEGKSLDLREARNADYLDCSCFGTNNLKDLNGSEIIVITAGFPRQPGMTREDLLNKNADIIRNVVTTVKTFNPQPIIIMVTNPLDVMTYLALKISGFPKNRVIGMAGVLDSSRMAHFVAEKLNTSVKDVRAMVLGSHGDSMVAIPRFTTVSGIPITNLLGKEDVDWICQKTRDAGAEIVAYLKKGSAFYAPGSSVSVMVHSILKDEKRILPCSVFLNGEYKLNDVVIGVPVKLGSNGIEKIVEVALNNDELSALHKSAEIIKNNIKDLRL